MVHTLKIEEPIFFFGSDIGICAAQSQRTFENRGLVTKVKKYLHWSMTGKILLHIGKIQAKQGIGWLVWFVPYCNSWWVWGKAAQPQETFSIYTLSYVWKQYSQLSNWHKIVTEFSISLMKWEKCGSIHSPRSSFLNPNFESMDELGKFKIGKFTWKWMVTF